jgi:hypothetical protein
LTAREVKTPVSAPKQTAGNIELKNEFQDFDFMASPVVIFYTFSAARTVRREIYKTSLREKP